MTIPTIFFMFFNCYSNLILGDQFITTLVFDEPVGRVHHGLSNAEIFLDKSPDGKMIFLKSLGKDIETNLTVPTRDGKKFYTFYIRRGVKPHGTVFVKDGHIENSFKRVSLKNGIEIEEGKYSVKITNKRKIVTLVNGVSVKPRSSIFASKGPSIFVNKERFYK